MQAEEERTLSNDPEERLRMPPLPVHVLMEIYSAVVGDDVLHFVTLADGSTDEDWGPKGIERLLEKYVSDDRRLLHPHFAKHFFGEIDAKMTGEYTITVDVTAESDIENVRITRPGQATALYPHRFDLFESGGWWLV